MSIDEQMKRYALACRLYGGSQVELSPEERSLIRERLAALYSPIVAGQAGAMLE
jgi:hypothetical protein